MDYGISKTIPKSDKRQKLWKRQREKRGFDNTELWNLNATIAKFLAPRLKEFKKCSAYSIPNNFDDRLPIKERRKLWEEVLQEMIDGFEIIADEKKHYDFQIYNKEYRNKEERAIKLLFEYYFSLWY